MDSASSQQHSFFGEDSTVKKPNRPSGNTSHEGQSWSIAGLLCPSPIPKNPVVTLELARVSFGSTMVSIWQNSKKQQSGCQTQCWVRCTFHLTKCNQYLLFLPYITEEMFVWISTSRLYNGSSSQQLRSHFNRCWAQDSKLYGEMMCSGVSFEKRQDGFIASLNLYQSHQHVALVWGHDDKIKSEWSYFLTRAFLTLY